ncbi:MAG: DUF1615 family protein [Zoogloea sp.]|nr:DUF1615 family protein [Zoogloea sp.]
MVLAGCASTGPVESHPSPNLPPAPGTSPAPVAPKPPISAEPPRVVPAPVPAPQPAPLPAPRPAPAPYPDENEGRALVASYLPFPLKDRDGWAADIFSAFSALRIPVTPDNICAAIAVTEQESTFQADPEVAGLSRIEEKGYPYPRRGSVRDEVFTRRGGMYFGIAILLDYPAPYSRPLYRFADFNAGRYSSRNAAFQDAVAKLTGQALALDGDLLCYADGVPAAEPSATLAALQGLAGQLGLSRSEMQRDLRLEKTARFSGTPLYSKIFALADNRTGTRLPRETMPRIDLKSPKIQRKLTTAWFAERVDARHRTCLGRNRSATP